LPSRESGLILDRVTGADQDDWMAAVRDEMRRQRAELHDVPPFTVWGISSPALYPCAVRRCERDGTGWRAMTLGYGNPHAGAAISVRSSLDLGRRHRPDLRSALDPPYAKTIGRLVVAGVPRQLELLAGGDRWAATLAVADVRLTVLGNAVRPDSVWLVPVDDLSLYRRPQEPPWLPGLDPHRVLLDTLQRIPKSQPHRHFRQWLRAVRAQQLISGGDRKAAASTLRDLLNHVAALRSEPWFAERSLRQAAVEETLRHTCCGAEVSSLRAQQAWRAGDSDAWRLAWSAWSVNHDRADD
jgi:hypothetical protein